MKCVSFKIFMIKLLSAKNATETLEEFLRSVANFFLSN